MYRMLDVAYADGVTSLLATPHATPGIYPFPIEKIEKTLLEAKAYCKKMKYNMSLYEGAEILYTPAIERFVQERKLPTLAGTNKILVEFVPDITMSELRQALMIVRSSGYQIILAHIERYNCMYGFGAYHIKKQFDVNYQINCDSVLKGCGTPRNIFISKWLKDGLIDSVASDAHDYLRRPSCMQKTYDCLRMRYGTKYASKLTGIDGNALFISASSGCGNTINLR